MVVPLRDIVAAVLHDEDGNPISSVLDGATRRLAVDAVVGSGGVFDEDTDDDSIAAGQTTLLSIVLNYQFDGTVQRRVQARAANTALDQSLMYTLVRAVVSGVDSAAAAGSEIKAVEASNFAGAVDVDNALIGLLTNARLAYFDIATNDWGRLEGDVVSSAIGVSTASPGGIYANAVAFGVDTTGAAVLAAVEARNGDADGDFAEALVALLVNARLAANSTASGDNRRLFCDTPAVADGLSTGSEFGLYVNGVTFGVDTTGAAVLAAVEGRNGADATDFSADLISLLVNTRPAAFSPVHNDYRILMGCQLVSTDDDQANTALMGQAITEPFESGYWYALRGRRYNFNPAATAIAGTTSFTATAPQVIIVGGATNDHMIRKIRVSLSVVGGTPPVIARLVIDTADRYTSGGTARTPSNQNTGSAGAAGGDHYVDASGSAIVATAAGGGTREISTRVISNAVGAEIEWEFKDGLILAVSDSLLLYVHDSGGSAPSFYYEIEFEEGNVQ